METKYFNFDTIIAPATAIQSGGALGIIRVSGRDALMVAMQVMRPKQSSLVNAETGTFSDALISHHLYQASFFAQDGRLIDLGVFVWMKGPNSFTGEDVVEFHLHGNPLIMNEVISASLASGLVRMAEAGEFSFRAFRNGKLDLAQAESISNLITAKSLHSVRASARALEGTTSSLINGLRDRLVNLLAQVELDIDFSDQGVPQLDYSRLIASVLGIAEELAVFHQKFLKSRPVQDGIHVAIVGAPNSGKSTLFNQILRMDRSIVSDIAGTTRDVVKESVFYSGMLFVFADTAGLRTTSDIIEQKGIERSYLAVESADVVIFVVDAVSKVHLSQEHLAQVIGEIKARRSDVPIFLCLNKSDALGLKDSSELLNELKDFSPTLISALSGSGVDSLLDSVTRFFVGRIGGDDSPAMWHARHGLELGAAKESLFNLYKKLEKDGMREPDLISVDLRVALDHLRGITGEFTSDDLLNHIFSKFCIGK